MWAQKITQQREAKLNSPEVRMYTSDISAFVFMVVVLHSSTRLMHLMPSGLDWHCWAPAHSFSPCASDFDFLDLDIYISNYFMQFQHPIHHLLTFFLGPSLA